MPKNIQLQTWVKNVYSLWVEGVVNRANLSTPSEKQRTTATQQRVQPTFSTMFINMYPLYLYTAFFRQLTDTILPLSTLSTAPIIKKMN